MISAAASMSPGGGGGGGNSGSPFGRTNVRHEILIH